MPQVNIGGMSIGENRPVFILAEVGLNHNGDLGLAKRLIDVAVDAGCQAVKFQKRTIPLAFSESDLKKPREAPAEVLVNAIKRGVLPSENVARLAASNFQNATYGDAKWALEFTESEYREIDSYCKTKGILWTASVWDEASVDFLERFNPPVYKIPSPSLTDDSLLRRVRSTGRPVILSTGMSTVEEIDHAVAILGAKDLVLMHCVSTYPCELGDINLRVIEFLAKRYNVPIGYSGHEKGVYPSVHSIAHGACMVERHITLDRTMWGGDQAASLEPKGLSLLVKAIKVYEKSRGDGVKRVLESELVKMKTLRRNKSPDISVVSQPNIIQHG